MAMFPVFIVGLIAGCVLGYVFGVYKKDTPSETKLRLQEATIIELKEDIKLLEKENERLSEEVSKKKKLK